MAGTRKIDRGLHHLTISNLADQDDIRRLPHRTPQSPGIRFSAQADFTLIDDGLLIGVEKLDWVLDRECMIGFGIVNEVDHGRKRRGLAGPGRPRDGDEAARMHRDVLEDAWTAQVLQR